jgi:hypothetical protein
MRRKEKVVHSGLAVFLLTCLLFSSAFASLGIKEMQFSFENLPYYSNQMLGFSQGTSLSADVAIPTGPSTVEYAYSIRNAVVTLSNMPLTLGYGTNSGTFSGPATLTVTGRLIKNATLTDLTGNVTLFVAQMDSASLVLSQIFANYADGAALFTPTSGALVSGVADGSVTLVLPEFAMGLWGWGANVSFANNSMSPPNAGVQITTDAVPEPMTLSLLSAGIFMLSRKWKNV